VGHRRLKVGWLERWKVCGGKRKEERERRGIIEFSRKRLGDSIKATR